MYVPAANAVDDPEVVLALLRAASFGHFVSHHGDSFDATGLPFLVDDELSTLRAHFARANPHWRTLDRRPVLIVVPVTDSYVSPNWYPSKADDPRVVPTWNYEVVHLHGIATVHDDRAFLEQVVRDLTDLHEHDRAATDGTTPWSVDDAPDEFVERKLRAIVGIQVSIERVVAKRKLSQNRDRNDRVGVVDHLGRSNRSGELGVVDSMRGLDRADQGFERAGSG